jgi:hypothetical protein
MEMIIKRNGTGIALTGAKKAHRKGNSLTNHVCNMALPAAWRSAIQHGS